MALYVVLRHPRNPEQVWSNGWRPDDRLVDAIMTNGDVAPLCEQARATGEYVYVHRCAWGGADPAITSRAKVESGAKIDLDFYVRFSEPESVSATPRVRPPESDRS
jgi:hypothetical protein